MNEMKERLEESKVFCMAPWTHLHIFPDSRVFPCCWASTFPQQQAGRLDQSSLEEIWNSPLMKKLRMNMLSEKPTHEVCHRCYNLEKVGVSSLRRKMNGQFSNHAGLVNTTRQDGSLEKLNLPYWDVRFSNLCNMKCRSCGPPLSSSWGIEAGLTKDQANVRLSVTAPKALESLVQRIGDLEEIYFAGGEPLIMEEHYQVLERLIELKKTDVRLRYNTNFSQLNYKNGSVLNLWKHFEQIHLGASLDGMGTRAEYIRCGTKWKVIEENRKLLAKECPHVFFNVESTISVLNALHIFDFIEEWAQLNYISPHSFFANLLEQPVNLCIQELPTSLKIEVEERADQFIAKMKTVWPNQAVGAETFGKTIVNFMNARKPKISSHEVLHFLKAFDRIRNQSWETTFPELRGLEN